MTIIILYILPSFFSPLSLSLHKLKIDKLFVRSHIQCELCADFILFYFIPIFVFFYKNDWCNCSVARKSFFFSSKFIVNGNSLWICFSSVFVLCFLLTCYLWGYFYKYSHRLGKSKHNTLNETIKVNCIFHVATLWRS